MNRWNGLDQLQYVVMMAVKSAVKPLEWNEIWKLTEIWKGGKLRRASFQAAFLECVKNGWIKEGQVRVVNNKIVHFYELNPETVAPAPFGAGLSMVMPVLPYATEELEKWQVEFSSNGSAISKEQIRRPVKNNPDKVVVVERATVNLRDVLDKKLAKHSVVEDVAHRETLGEGSRQE